jgi:hypothetical protein
MGSHGGYEDRVEPAGPIDEEALPNPSRTPEHPPRTQLLARRALVVLGLVYLVAQLAVVGTDRAPRWDESIYLSQVMPDMDGLYFVPWHSRGITLLVAPVTSLGGSLEEVRLFLMVLATAATTAAFWLWVPLVGMGAVVAAAAFAFSWLGLLSASEVMPNYWAALGALASAGFLVRRLQGGTVRNVLFASIALAAVTFVRPTEAIVFAGATGAYVLLFRRRYWRVLPAMGLGFLVGWLPWLIEMSTRFGGVPNALHEAGEGGHFAVVSVSANVSRYLAYTDGVSEGIPPAGVVWWALLVVGSIAGLARGATERDRASALVCSLAGLAFAVEYLAFVFFLNARFLLPAYALASLSFGVGVVALFRGRRPSRTAGGLMLAMMIPWGIWQAAVADRVEEGISDTPVRIGATIRELTGPHRCFFVSHLAYPKIAVSSRCQGAPWKRGIGAPTASELEGLRRPGTQLFVVLLKEAGRGSPLSELTPTRVTGPDRTWYVYAVPSPTG